MTAEVLKRLFAVEQFHRMIETGIIEEGDRVELIRGEIAEAWIVDVNAEDVNAELVEVHRQPSATEYRSLQTYVRGRTFELLAFPDVSIADDKILG